MVIAKSLFLSILLLATVQLLTLASGNPNTKPPVNLCVPEHTTASNPASIDRHLLLVHVSSIAGKDDEAAALALQNQLAKFSAAAKYAIDAGVEVDCQYRQVSDDQLPLGYLKLAGQTVSWPLLFQDGAITGEALLERLSEQPAVVQDLDDATFEGLTQASTGSTTGHWLVAFLDPADRQLAKKTSLLWGLAQTLRRSSRINVARVFLGDASHDTSARFSIKDKEAAVLLRSGGFYPVPHRLLDWQLVVAFSVKGFNNHKRLAVPPPPSPFDHAVDAVLAFLTSFNSVWGVSPVFIALSSGALVVAGGLALVCLCAGKGLAKVAGKVD